jgi:glycosyltransferase involved in cell wall biosynthesis
MNNIGIVIATRNRLGNLEILLKSITDSLTNPSEIILVYSGMDVSSVAIQFQDRLNIKIIHSPRENQRHQKFLGIEALSASSEWVLFLDDDLKFTQDTLNILIENYMDNQIYSDAMGFGLNIHGIMYPKHSSLLTPLLKYFGLWSPKSGVVLSSGHAQEYQNVETDCEISWANGISIWKKSVLWMYEDTSRNTEYSAYEDVIFSYKVSRQNKIYFASKAIVLSQKLENPSKLTSKQFISGGYFRLDFVTNNDELSLTRMMVAHIARSFHFVFLGDKKSCFLERIYVSIKLYLILIGKILLSKLN